MAFRLPTQSRSSRNASYAWMALMLVAITGTVSYAVYHFVSAPRAADSTTLCPADGPKGHVVLLVDKSDPMTFTQSKAFEVMYRQTITDAVPKGYLLSVYALSDDFAQTAEPLMERCNPGDGSDVSQFDSNPVLIKKSYDQKYLQPLLALRTQLQSDRPGRASPILEMVQLANITGFTRHNVQGERRLLVVSDMIQNTPGLDMYRQGIPDYRRFAAEPYGRKVHTDLRGVKVSIRMLLNTPTVQTPALLEFWMDHVQKSGGRIVSHEPLP